MRKLIFTLIIYFAVGNCFPWTGSEAFFDTDISVNAGVTKIDGTEFTSNVINLIGKSAAEVGITFIFTRAAGTESTVKFDFEICFSGVMAWATLEGGSTEIPTNQTAVTGNIVRVFKLYNLKGVNKIKIKRIYNADGANNVTGVNVHLSY